MYALMAFIVWRGGYHLHSSQFATYASVASGSWVCFSARRREQGRLDKCTGTAPIHPSIFCPSGLCSNCFPVRPALYITSSKAADSMTTADVS
ncbi:TPA: hypothetical protein ACH3X3_001290 [Trebouxia sp. C0006]